MKRTFQEFYQDFGLNEYPFLIYTAEQENKEKLFIKPEYFSILEDSYNNGISIILNGNRGTGKTIILKELKKLKFDKENIICFIDNYEEVSLKNNIKDFFSLFLSNITRELIIYLMINKKLLKKISKEDKLLISFLIYKYGDNISESQIKSRIENIQLNVIQKNVNRFSKVITAFLNYWATAATKVGNEVINMNFGKYLPQIDEKSIKAIFPDIKFDIVDDFKKIEISYDLLEKSLKVIRKLNIDKIIIILDKLDEDNRLCNDAEEIEKFIEALFIDNRLLLNENIQLIISVWTIPFENLCSKIRRQKHFVFDILWQYNSLENVLNQRLRVYSDFRIDNYKVIFNEDIDESDYLQIFKLANENPRDLWHIMNKIFLSQYKLDDNVTKLSRTAINNGLKEFVKTFPFYEYYPRKKNSHKNTNDIYSYIQHLQKLKTNDFTNAELKEAANTGGSTTNYITGMMNIGVINKTDAKRNGSVLYVIRDPKIVYAIDNDINIERIRQI